MLPKHPLQNFTLVLTFARISSLPLVQRFLVPELWPGAIVVMDNLSSHKSDSIISMIEAVGASVLFLSSYSPAVPEPFTIIGTIIGGTAAFRMRKKLKAITE